MAATLKLRRFIGSALLVLSTLVATGCTEFLENGRWRTFSSPTIGYFSTEYPAWWKSERFVNGYRGDADVVALFFPPAPQLFPVVRIVRKSVDAPTVDDTVSWGLERFQALNADASDQFEVLPPENITVDGAETMSREFIMDTETPLPLKRKDVYIARREDMLIITLISTLDGYEEALPLFDHMIDSFENLEE